MATEGMTTPVQPPAPIPSAPIPAARIERDRKHRYYDVAFAARKQGRYMRGVGRRFDEEGNELAPYTPEDANVLQKLVGLMMVLGPRAGERGHIPADLTPDTSLPEPKTFKEIQSDLQTIRLYDHSGESSKRGQKKPDAHPAKKRKRTKAG